MRSGSTHPPHFLSLLAYSAQRARLLEEAKGSGEGSGGVIAKKFASGNQGGGVAAEVGFENMAKTIAKRWKQLTPEELEPFQQLAKQDMARYRREMEEYQQELVRQSRREREKSAAESARGDSRAPPAPYPAPNHAASSLNDHSPPRSAAPADAISSANNWTSHGLVGATNHRTAAAASDVHQGPQEQDRYSNVVLSHLEALLQQQAQQQQQLGIAAPAAASIPNLSTGDLNYLAASALSQMLLRQPPPPPWNSSSTNHHQSMWNLSSLQQQQQNLQLLQHQQQQQQQQQQLQQRQLDNFTNAAQLALLQQLLNLPVPGNGGAALSPGRQGAAQAPSASDPQQGHGDDSSEPPRDDPSLGQPPHERRNP
jgi:HMG (high mobility group) box